jgi:hypothetical protein
MREHLRHEPFGRPELEAASAAPVATEHAARIVHAGALAPLPYQLSSAIASRTLRLEKWSRTHCDYPSLVDCRACTPCARLLTQWHDKNTRFRLGRPFDFPLRNLVRIRV